MSTTAISDTAKLYTPQLAKEAETIRADLEGRVATLEGGGLAGVAPLHFARGASTANIASLAAASNAIDGLTYANGERILLKDQSTGSQNGIYVWSGIAAGTGVLTRASDMSVSADAQSGMLVSVSEGTAAADTIWQLQTNAPITLGTDALTFAAVATQALGTSAPQDVTTGAASAGAGVTAAKIDHVHHFPAATDTTPGAMPFADKAFLDLSAHGNAGAALTDADATVQPAGKYWRTLPAATLTVGRTLTLGTTNAAAGDQFTITRLDATANTYAIVNGGVGAGTLYTFPVSKTGFFVAEFDGTNWVARAMGVGS